MATTDVCVSVSVACVAASDEILNAKKIQSRVVAEQSTKFFCFFAIQGLEGPVSSVLTQIVGHSSLLKPAREIMA
jgi:hypothetical protein